MGISKADSQSHFDPSKRKSTHSPAFWSIAITPVGPFGAFVTCGFSLMASQGKALNPLSVSHQLRNIRSSEPLPPPTHATTLDLPEKNPSKPTCGDSWLGVHKKPRQAASAETRREESRDRGVSSHLSSNRSTTMGGFPMVCLWASLSISSEGAQQKTHLRWTLLFNQVKQVFTPGLRQEISCC